MEAEAAKTRMTPPPLAGCDDAIPVANKAGALSGLIISASSPKSQGDWPEK